MSGGRLGLVLGNPNASKNPGPQGTINVSSLLNLTGGTVERYGLIEVADAGTVAQSGGSVLSPVQIHTPSYVQTGGMMSGQVTATTYDISGVEGEAPTEMAGVVYLDRQFTMADGSLVTGWAAGDGSAAMVQTGGAMEGSASGLTSYTLTGGTIAGTIEFSDLFGLSGTGTIEWAPILGTTDAEFNQSGGTMGGDVYAPVGSEDWTAIAKYSQTGGDMTGVVTTRTYEASGGTITGMVEFAELFVLSGDASVGYTDLNGDGDAAMTQSGGTMGAWVTGIDTYSQSGGDMTEWVTADTYEASGGNVSGKVDFSERFALSGDAFVKAGSHLNGDGDAAMTQTGGTMAGGTMAGEVGGISTYTMSGGAMTGSVATEDYALSGGTLLGQVHFGGTFALSATGEVIEGAALYGDWSAQATQSGGTMNGLVTGIGSYIQTAGAMTGSVTAAAYEHAGGSMTGAIDVGTYSLTGAGTSAGTISASSAFNLGFGGDVAVVGARLSGAGDVVKSGTSTVVLTNSANDFTGDVVVNGGTLQVQDAALPGEASIEMANGATLLFDTGAGAIVQFDGTMTGDTGILEKSGAGTLTLGGDIYLGALQVSGGLLNIGNGAPEEASFDSAYIAEGATLYVASGATLRVRIPKNIANFGTLTNDGTVYDDLDNAGMFVNNAVYVANVASNTRDIANNSPGVWTGDILANNGWINNNENATWNGNVVTNDVRVANAGSTWRGNIVANNGHIINDNRSDEIGTGYWIGDVISNNNWIFNGGGGDWTGDVRSNANLVMNDGLATWNGDVLSNASWVWNLGHWNGDVVANANAVENTGGTWTGDVQANTGTIANIQGIRLDLPTAHSTWNGNVVTNGGTIINGAGSNWTGDVLGNSGTISTRGLWTGNFNNAGTVGAQNQIVGAFSNSGTLQVTGNRWHHGIDQQRHDRHDQRRLAAAQRRQRQLRQRLVPRHADRSQWYI